MKNLRVVQNFERLDKLDKHAPDLLLLDVLLDLSVGLDASVQVSLVRKLHDDAQKL